MKAWFDPDGRLLCTQRGDMSARGPEGATAVDIADDADINRIALVDGEMVSRELMMIGADRTIFVADGQDAPALSGTDDAASLLIDGQLVPVDGEIALTSAESALRVVEPALAHYGPPLLIRFLAVAEIAAALRAERDTRLTACDWTQAGIPRLIRFSANRGEPIARRYATCRRISRTRPPKRPSGR
jgi:hypothetical protein